MLWLLVKRYTRRARQSRPCSWQLAGLSFSALSQVGRHRDSAMAARRPQCYDLWVHRKGNSIATHADTTERHSAI
jgi:hypothetical protein